MNPEKYENTRNYKFTDFSTPKYPFFRLILVISKLVRANKGFAKLVRANKDNSNLE